MVAGTTDRRVTRDVDPAAVRDLLAAAGLRRARALSVVTTFRS
jgi:hypothetical protein